MGPCCGFCSVWSGVHSRRGKLFSPGDSTEARVPFPCTSCGACCVLIPSRIEGWPLAPNGACICLSADNQCVIYDDRPRACRVDALEHSMSEAEYYAATANICNAMQEALDIDPRFRVVLAGQ
jgi:Fe-S-cluster containining protein